MTDNETVTQLKSKTFHFHTKHSIGLTITACPVLGREGFYAVGVSLPHKEQGSRKEGFASSYERCLEVVNDRELDSTIENMKFRVVGSRGRYLVKDWETVILIADYLRYFEDRDKDFNQITVSFDIVVYGSSSKVSSMYHKAFFNMAGLLKKAEEWDSDNCEWGCEESSVY